MPWPTGHWPIDESGAPPGLAAVLERAMDPDAGLGQTRAVVVIHRGRLVAERYGERTDADGNLTGEPVDATTPLISWSMAKSLLHAVVGMVVLDGLLDIDDPAPVSEWPAGDPRRTITIRDLLAMRDGLEFIEDYEDATSSHVIDMLYGDAIADTGGYVATRPLAHDPGTRFNYSSGTSNLLSRIVRDVLGGQEEYRSFLRDRLFAPLGMHSADPRFDDAGTWIASSYLWASARDLARFGELYLRDGVWEGRRLLPDGWVDGARRPLSRDEEDGLLYGLHWWVTGDRHGSFWASGYQGQSIIVSPGLDLVVVRMGKTVPARYPALTAWRAEVVDAFA